MVYLGINLANKMCYVFVRHFLMQEGYTMINKERIANMKLQ